MKKIFFIAIFVAIISAIGIGIFVARKSIFFHPKMYRIGVLVRGSGYDRAVEGYRETMKKLGYQEGKNIIYDIKFISAREELPKAVKDFIAEGVDLIHTYSTPATQAAYQETKNLPHPIPIVFGSMGDPLISGVIKDLQHPGTNVTGIASLSTELTAKRLELLKRINPAIHRVAMPHTAQEAGDAAANKSVKIAQETAPSLGIELILFPVKSSKENTAVASRIIRKNIDGIIVGGDSLVWGGIETYIKQALQEKIPFAAFDLEQVKKGALVGFGPDYKISGEQAARLTHQILRGNDPAEIPIEVPQKLLLVINMRTAETIGIPLDSEFIKTADIIIK